MSPLSLFYFVLAIAGFGSAFALSNVAVSHFSPIHVATARAVVAAVATALFVLAMGIRIPRTERHVVIYIILGVLTVAAPFALIAWSQSMIDSSLGGVIFASMPLVTLLLGAVVLTDAIPTTRQLSGAIIGLAGVFYVATGGDINTDGSQLLGAGLTLLAVFCYSLGGVFVKRFDDIDPRAMSFGQLIAAMIILVIISFWNISSLTLPDSYAPYLVVLWLGVFSTAMPMMAIFLLIQREGPAPASMTAFFMPIMAMGIGALWMSEPISKTLILGTVLVLIGAWLVVHTPASREKITAIG